MWDAVQSSFDKFLSAAEESFSSGRNSSKSDPSLRVLITDDQLLRKLVVALEQRDEFTELVDASTSAFLLSDDQNGTSLREEIKTYFRLSGFYQATFAGEPAVGSTQFKNYVDAFTQATNKVVHLAPIQFVRFPSDVMECGGFELRRYKPSELNRILKNDARRIFYPYSCIDTEELARFWLASVTEDVPRHQLGFVNFRFALEWRHPATSLAFPDSVRHPFQCLALYDWRRILRNKQGAPPVVFVRGRAIIARPRVPLTISASEGLIHWPDASPDLVNSFGRQMSTALGTAKVEFNDPFQFNEAEAEHFVKFMREISQSMEIIRNAKNHWEFVEQALDFLYRGFACEGIEQLLWNVTAIESLFGQKQNAGLTGLLKRRLSAVLGSTPEEQRKVRKQFDKVYDARSNYIHGNAVAVEKIEPQTLIDARGLARRALVWMIRCLEHVGSQLAQPELPTREVFLSTLDLDSDRRREMQQLLSSLPGRYPAVPEWQS